MQTQQLAAFTATPILTLKALGFEGTVGLDQAKSWVGRAFRGTDRPLGSVSRGRTVLRIGSRGPEVRSSLRVRPPERSVLLRGLQRPELGWLQSGRVRGTGTNTPDFPTRPAALAAQAEAGNRRELTDRQPGPVSFARILNPGYQKAGRKEARHGEAARSD